MNNNGSVVSFGSKFALFQRRKFIITLFLWVKMKVERVMGIEPTYQIPQSTGGTSFAAVKLAFFSLIPILRHPAIWRFELSYRSIVFIIL